MSKRASGYYSAIKKRLSICDFSGLEGRNLAEQQDSVTIAYLAGSA